MKMIRNAHLPKIIKYIICSLLLFDFLVVKGQNYILPEGEFMDTVLDMNPSCKNYNVYYYNLRCKYPKSSFSILKDVQSFLLDRNEIYSGDGYITFRFRVSCNGVVEKRTQVMQTDKNYKNYHFDKRLVDALFSFLKTLDKWEIPKPHNGEPSPFSYITFITFKVKNGKISNIIP